MSTVKIISREEWDAEPWRGTVHTVSPSERTEFFVHYHGGIPRNDRGDANAKEVERIHLNNGWAGVGYNFLVGQDGVAREGRGWDGVGAHCPGHNRSGIGVYVAVGGDQDATDEALATVRALYDEACERAGFELARKGHRDGKATECPGDKLYAWVKDGMPVPMGAGGLPSRTIDTESDRPLLREGSRGRHVEPVIARLIELGFGSALDPKSDIFGPKTEAAVKEFQKAAGIAVDGIVGPITYMALDAGVRKEQPKPKPKPKRVKADAPAAKPKLAPGELVVDGILGPKTIARWQEVMGTPVDGVISKPFSKLIERVQLHLNRYGNNLKVDGKLGPNTIRALQRYLGTPQTGAISERDSVVIKALQRRLNTGRF